MNSIKTSYQVLSMVPRLCQYLFTVAHSLKRSVNIQINLIKLNLINLNKFFDNVQSLRIDTDSFLPYVTDDNSMMLVGIDFCPHLAVRGIT